jgi:hypothetical protein
MTRSSSAELLDDDQEQLRGELLDDNGEQPQEREHPMSMALALLRQMRSGGSMNGYDDSGFDDSGYDDSGYDDSGYDDSGASFRERRAANLRQRAGNVEQRGMRRRSPSPEQMLAREVENNQISAAARLQLAKKKYVLFRMIPLVATQSVAIAGNVAINTTPTTKAWAEQMTASGNFSITALVMGGQTLVPNGTVGSKFFENVSTYNRPLNIELDTVPITGNILNNTGVASVCSLDLMTWMENTAASERF